MHISKHKKSTTGKRQAKLRPRNVDRAKAKVPRSFERLVSDDMLMIRLRHKSNTCLSFVL